jgi:alkanesulfonate monooxygenase SsuD/methylene tetrahydromethanopterin reductase-like flavin-dependent oxidoreductase (luciferase family)
MRAGVILPQGWFGEFEGWDPTRAFDRVLELALLSEQLGFDSLWTGEHVTTKWGGEQNLLECFTVTAALAALVPRVELGTTVINSTFRNPALTAKMASTVDVLSRGRFILGLGAGFRRDEYEAFGYEFGSTTERLAILAEHLEIITQMVTQGTAPATYTGDRARVVAAVNCPRSVRAPRIPILIGGHGPNITFRLAARYCDEINLDVLPAETAGSLRMLGRRCEEAQRDPSTLAVSISVPPSLPWAGLRATGGQRMMTADEVSFATPEQMRRLFGTSRVEALTQWREQGLSRVTAGVPGLAETDEPLYEFLDDCRAAGLEMARTGRPGPENETIQ